MGDHYSQIIDRLVSNVQKLQGMLDDGTLVLVKGLDAAACTQARNRVEKIRDLARRLHRHELGGVIPEERLELYEKLANERTPAALCSDVIAARAMMAKYTDKLLRMAEADLARAAALATNTDRRRARVAVAGPIDRTMCHVGPFDSELSQGGTVPVESGMVVIHYGSPATQETLGDMEAARIYELRGVIEPMKLDTSFELVQHGAVTGAPADIIAEATRVWGGGVLFIDSGDGRIVVQAPALPGAFEWVQSILAVDRFTVKYLDRAGIRAVLDGSSGRTLHIEPRVLKAWFGLKGNKGFMGLVKDYVDLKKGTLHVPADAADDAKRVVRHLLLWNIRANHVQDASEFKARFGSKAWDKVDLDRVTEYIWAEFGHLLYINEAMIVIRYKLLGRTDEPVLLTPSAYATGGQHGYNQDRFITSPNGNATGLKLPADMRYTIIVPGDNCPALQFAENFV
jgi:hypothetical protein